MRLGLVAVSIWLMAPIVHAAEYKHCYIGLAPDDAPLSSQHTLSGLLLSVQVATLKTACDMDTDADRIALDAMVANAECTPESEVAEYVDATFEATPENTRAMLEDDPSFTPEVFAALCKAAESCTPSDTGQNETCQEALRKAMQGE